MKIKSKYDFFSFGKYEGNRFIYILKKDPSYIVWCYNNALIDIESDEELKRIFKYASLKKEKNYLKSLISKYKYRKIPFLLIKNYNKCISKIKSFWNKPTVIKCYNESDFYA